MRVKYVKIGSGEYFMGMEKNVRFCMHISIANQTNCTNKHNTTNHDYEDHMINSLSVEWLASNGKKDNQLEVTQEKIIVNIDLYIKKQEIFIWLQMC